MIVIDASAMVAALVRRDVDPVLMEAISGDLAAPYLLDFEVLSALRGLVLGRKLQPTRADEAIADFYDLSIDRHGLQPLAGRVWALRERFTSYDASYLALAEALGVDLMTCDAKMLELGSEWIRFVT